MSIFIIWPVTDDTAFRSAYAVQTGEFIQDAPPINAAHDHYMVGTSRADQADCEALALIFPGLVFGANPDDLGWIGAPEDDIL